MGVQTLLVAFFEIPLSLSTEFVLMFDRLLHMRDSIVHFHGLLSLLCVWKEELRELQHSNVPLVLLAAEDVVHHHVINIGLNFFRE